MTASELGNHLSPESGTRKQKTRDVASHVATLQAPAKLAREAELSASSRPNRDAPRILGGPTDFTAADTSASASAHDACRLRDHVRFCLLTFITQQPSH